MGHWKNRWIQTPQQILMDPCLKQAPVLSKRFWIIPWPLAYNRLELDCIRKIINFWYTFGWKWRVFLTIYDCRTHVRMTSMMSSVERTDLNFKISVALLIAIGMRQDMVGETADSILVKEGRVGITFLFHSNCLISQCCFYQNIMIPYTLKIYDFLSVCFLSRKNSASTLVKMCWICVYF